MLFFLNSLFYSYCSFFVKYCNVLKKNFFESQTPKLIYSKFVFLLPNDVQTKFKQTIVFWFINSIKFKVKTLTPYLKPFMYFVSKIMFIPIAIKKKEDRRKFEQTINRVWYSRLNPRHSIKFHKFSLITIKNYTTLFVLLDKFNITKSFTLISKFLQKLILRDFSFGFQYIIYFGIILFIDACLSDDEPLWEPIEWSLVQTWILFIFLFGWIAENLITSRYGSYTGRDKRVWMAWYKSFWLIEMYYVLNFAVAALFVVIPFYFEINYHLAFLYSWWNWYSKTFFLKFLFIFSIILLLAQLLQNYTRWWNKKKLLIIVILINMFLSYLLYIHFVMSFFGYFTDPIWYQKYRHIDYIQLSHEPSKWGWNVAKRDHFTYHITRTVFWFKNDGQVAAILMLFHLYLFLSLFFIYIYWITLFRRIYTTQEISLTYLTYCISTLRQFYYCFIAQYTFIISSYCFQFWRSVQELWWTQELTLSWFNWFKNFVIDCRIELTEIYTNFEICLYNSSEVLFCLCLLIFIVFKTRDEIYSFFYKKQSSKTNK